MGNGSICTNGDQQQVLIPELTDFVANLQEAFPEAAYWRIGELAAAALNATAEKLPSELLETQYVAMVQRLAKDHSTVVRAACAHLLSIPYPSLRDHLKSVFRTIFFNLSRDSSIAVRVAACSALKSFIPVVADQQVISELAQLFAQQSADKEFLIRESSVENCIQLAETLVGPKKNCLLPSVRDFSKDASPNIRRIFAHHFLRICQAMSGGMEQREMAELFMKLATDETREVRSTLAHDFLRICQAMSGGMEQREMVELFMKLAADKTQEVRSTLAKNVIGFSLLIQKDQAIVLLPVIPELVSRQNRYEIARLVMQLSKLIGLHHTITSLLPHFSSLLQDKFPKFAENFPPQITAAMDSQTLGNCLSDAIRSLATDGEWRVRELVVKEIPFMADHLGVSFDSFFGPLLVQSLCDPVSDVRLAAGNVARCLAKCLGQEWANASLIPAVLALLSEHWSRRMSVLYALRQTSSVLGEEIITRRILPTVCQLSTDDVPNIRLNCCKALGELILKFETSSARALILPVLTRLSYDIDRDVQFYAREALQSFYRFHSS